MSKRFLSSALALALCFFIFAGCGEEAVDDAFSPEDYTEDYFDPHEALRDRTEYTPVPRDVLDKTFTLTEAQATAVTDTISSIKVDYANSQMYNLQACMDAYNKLTHTPAPPSHEIIQNGKVEYDTLLQSVLENNSHKEDTGYYGELPQKEVEKVVKLVVETINYNLPRNPYIDQNILDHKLKALKIRTFSDFGYGVYTYSDNVIGITGSSVFSPEAETRMGEKTMFASST